MTTDEAQIQPGSRPAAHGGWLAVALARGPLGIALPLLLLLALLCYFRFVLYVHQHWNNDIGGYIFGAETFALGKLKVPIPTPDHPDQRREAYAPQFFRTWMVVPHSFNDVDRRGQKYRFQYTRYPPGHPLVLFLGKRLLGSYIPIPLILSLLSAVALYLVLRRTAEEAAARWGLWLLALSPMFIGFGASLLSHNSTFFFLSYGLFSYVILEQTERRDVRIGSGFLCAFLYGMAAACRPMTGALFALPIAVREVWRARVNRAQLLSRWLPMLAGGGLALFGLLWYNTQLTGAPLHFPFHQYWPRSGPGFTGWVSRDISHWGPAERRAKKHLFRGIERTDGKVDLEQHTPWNAVCVAANQVHAFNRFFLPLPGALLLFILLLGRRRGSLPGLWWVYLAQVALVVVGHACIFRPTFPAWGPRFFYCLLLPVFLIFAPLLHEAWEETRMLSRRQRRFLVAGLLLLGGLYAVGVCREPYRKECETRDERGRILANIRKTVKRPAIVFLKPQIGDQGRYVGQYLGHLRNRPDLKGDILYAVNHGPRNRRLMEFYPQRNFYEIRTDGSVVPTRMMAAPPPFPPKGTP